MDKIKQIRELLKGCYKGKISKEEIEMILSQIKEILNV